MTPSSLYRHTTLRLIAIAGLVMALLSYPTVPVPVQAATSPPFLASFREAKTGNLSWRLATLASERISTQDSVALAQSLSVAPSGPASLTLNEAGAVLTSIRVADTSEATLATILSAGAEIVHVAPAYRTVTAYIAPEVLRNVAGLQQVENIAEVLHPEIGSSRMATGRSSVQQSSCATGIVSEGDQQLKAADGRAAFDVDGSGITVAALSDSFDRSIFALTTAAGDIASGDLPGPGNPCGRLAPVQVLGDLGAQRNTTATDEGRAMLHIVHDLAPGANLAFATAIGGELALADTIRSVRRAGADVIVDDIRYLTEPFYQDGPISVAIDEVTAQGVLYFTAAGNSNAFDANGNAISSYESSYRATPCPFTSAGDLGADCHGFSPTGGDPGFGITLAPGASFNMVFQWAQPFYGVQTDLDIFLVDESNNVVAGSFDRNTSGGTEIPVEILPYQNPTSRTQNLRLVVARFEGPTVSKFKFILTRSTGVTATEYNRSNSTDTFGQTVFGHGHASGALSLAAVPFSDAQTPETFSSRGPATIFFGPVLSLAPAAPVSSPVARQKPDVAATDGNRNPFFGQPASSAYRFFGTSSAAPHAAAVAALLRQRANQRNAPFTQRIAETVLETTAATVANGNQQSVGAGRVDAVNALYAVEQLRPLVPAQYLPVVIK